MMERLQEQMALIAPERLFDIRYEQFCNDPAATIRHIASRIPKLQLHPRFSLDELQPLSMSNSVRLPKPETERIQQRIEEREQSVISH